MKLSLYLAASALALSAFLATPVVAQDRPMPPHTDANGMPTNISTPAEHAATADLNNQASDANNQADAQSDRNDAKYKQQQRLYQDQLQQNGMAQRQFQDQTIAYEILRSRYAEQRSAYHRAAWPSRYTHWTLEDSSGNLTGQRIETVNGQRVGTVTDVAFSSNGKVEGVRVKLDNHKVVWIDQSDIRYDRAGRVLITDLDRAGLRLMAEES
jgi:sporulation protein YlmC with PRC-barrel domain